MKQLIKQSSSIGNLIPNLNKTTVKIYDAYKSMKRIQDFSSNNEMNQLVETIGQWAFYLGLSQKTSDKEIILLAQFIKENYGTFNLTDIQEAVKMSATDKLGIEVEHYGNISPSYISKILNAYKGKRGAIIVNTNQKIGEAQRKLDVKIPTKQESIDNMKLIISGAWETVHSQKEVYQDFGDCIYNFIKKNKLIVVNDKLVQDSMSYAKKVIQKEQREMSISSAINNSPFVKMDSETLRRKKAREFVVDSWLRSMDSKQVSDFTKNLNYN